MVSQVYLEASYAPEAESIERLLPHTHLFQKHSEAVFRRAEAYVETLRAQEPEFSITEFLKEYGLDTREGVTLMCLAEALLRVPDNATADALIQDKLKDADWERYLGKSQSVFVNASTWGLMLSGRFLELNDLPEGIGGYLGRLTARVGEPVVRAALKQAMRWMGRQFVLAETIEDALDKARDAEKRGYRFSYDMLGEGARTLAQAGHFLESYLHAIRTIGKTVDTNTALFERPSVSVKLSALHPRYELLQRERVLHELVPRMETIALAAKEAGISLAIDAEESWRLDIAVEVFATLARLLSLKSYEGLGCVVQAYHKRALPLLDYLGDLARERGCRLPVRLVKGAYWDSEIKRAQQLGLPDYPVFTRKSHTDVSYLACAARLLGKPQQFYPQFATHNALTVASIMEVAGDVPYEFQRLYGMGEDFYDTVVKEQTCRVYAPVGGHAELLPYLIRRLLENTANTSFVHQLTDREQPIRALLRDPLTRVRETQGLGRPDLPLPVAIFKNRKNATGLDLGSQHHLNILQEATSPWQEKTWRAAPLLSGDMQRGKALPVYTPCQKKHIVGSVVHADVGTCQHAVTAAASAFHGWNHTEVETRARALESAADLLETHRGELITLCQREAGKTLSDAIAEVREAADFCRYYAAEARRLFATPLPLPGYTGEQNQLSLHGRGPFVCISPWNFPLAIFMGQITAALAAGNTVLAKPAEQTPLIAFRAVQLLHQAGIPTEALHLLPGDGKAGAALVSDPRIAGVAFTGSTETAKHIQRALAEKDGPIVPLIAETGGQNAMIVDSTALLEQAVDDIIVSAFGSAGQRCSALRVLYVQEDIADALLTMLAGAMQELQMGDTLLTTTDIGPVIDAEAQTTLEKHIRTMHRRAKHIATTPLPRALAKTGYYVAPHCFEIPEIGMLTREVFGPVLHVIRYAAEALDSVIADINATGYGLTFGVQSRIAERSEYLCREIRAGNLYINRSMTGAVVGVQPFGGEGLSGTGPKAGSPYTLLRYATERTCTLNTTAIGGNVELWR
ncbi:MAG: bifunctional proline dehydrogenase/L-glutamate gamma-semialdehyde dehydrogenase PutA [Hyphomicrobiales bacterium]|nr:bifunctional proline dehydrogenase/L-glutamate gamma-semialdehyde dehydrogenase PutA [Hyphomicrobiales bacterium]